MSLELSDSELFQRLQKLGVDVGPITSTTRAIYMRKYKTLTAKQPSKPPPLDKQPQQPQKPLKSPQTEKKQDKTITTTTATPPTTPPPPVTSAPPPLLKLPVVNRLLASFNNPNHVASDTVFLFPSGELLLASRSILASQCSNLITMLYNTEVPYSVRVATLSGQSSEFMVRGGEMVRDLKEKISLVHSIPITEQRLIFKQQELPDNVTFSSMQVIPAATLHLVLAASAEANSPIISYTCPTVTPTLSIHHLLIGLSPDQLSCLSNPHTATPSPVKQAAPRVPLPPHITHIVHAHDSLCPGFEIFLRFLYSRDLDRRGSCSDYVMCYILAAYFKVSELAEACLCAIGSCLSIESSRVLWDFSKTIQSQPLEQLCIHFLETHSAS